VLVTDLAIVKKPMGKILLDFCRGNQGDVNFQVGLEYITTAVLYCFSLQI